MKVLKRSGRAPRRSAWSLSVMLGEMALSSMETIGRRTCMIAQGRCSPAEYRRMVQEKAAAAQQSALALVSPRKGHPAIAVLAPWHKKVKANAKRLRSK